MNNYLMKLEAWIRFQFFCQVNQNGRWRKARFSRKAKGTNFGLPRQRKKGDRVNMNSYYNFKSEF